MQPRTASLLEFHKVLACVAAQAVSEPGAKACTAIVPMTDPGELAGRQALLRQCLGFLGEADLPLPSFPPLEGVLAWIAQPHAVLDADGLWAVRETLLAAKAVRDRLAASAARERQPDLAGFVLDPRWPDSVHAALRRCLGNDGGLRDEASPELFSVRQEIRGIHQRCTSQVKDFVAKQGLSAYLQDDFMTISSDRYVLPLKTNFKGRLQGIIHDYSQTGETCYFEPMFLVEVNNRLQELKQEEREEERKVLVFLTGLVRAEEAPLRETYDMVVGLDVLLAKARLAGLLDGHVPDVGADRVELLEARHPLLALTEGATARPVDIVLKPGQRVLVISGANAAGKTVCLKTLGLTALMALAGLPVAVREGSCLPFWTSIFVFMGDEQSLEDHLSTFTAQIRHLSRAWPELDANALVLLDEFGAGTDPAQGAALAQAVVDKLLERGAYLAAATHFPALKAYGLTKEGVRSASMLFDPRTKKPLYVLAYDQVGASVALDVAREHGLPEEIVDLAQRYLLQGGADANTLYDRLNELALEREQELARLNKERARLEERRKTLAERFEKERRKLLDDLRGQARDLLRQIEAGKLGRKQALKELAETRRAVEKLGPVPSGEESAPQRGPTWEDVKIGDRVRLGDWDRPGLVREKDEKRRALKVDMGGVSLWSAFEDVTVLAPAAQAPAPRPVTSPPSQGGPALVLDLRGLRAEEALAELAAFLDRAILRGVREVEIVHGRGTGALRREVHAFLKDCPEVATFALAPEDRGGDGMTMAELK